MSNFVITTSALTKNYGEFNAVNNLNLQVPEGSVCGFLGQNGAGKSTTIKMLLGMTRPSSGEGSILGHDILDENESVVIRKKVAYVAEDKRLYDYMTVAQIIKFTRPFFENWQTDLEQHLLKEFRLPLDRKIKKLSKGMRTQLALILGICRNADILILDEPSEGLDPVNNEKVLRLLVSLAAQGKTIFFSSHHVFEVEQVSDYIIMLHRGKLIDSKPLEQMKEEYKLLKLFFNQIPTWDPMQIKGVKRFTIEANSMTLFINHNEKEIIDRIKAENPTSIEIMDLNLKDIFLENLKALENYAD
ncbi:MAG TPA: ABC transporter ATP-binding protein [Flavisolibacter sp.]|nr:ABC transporter ATP-binding protein [Flavisolibacter sp.]